MRPPIPIPESSIPELEAFRKKKWPGCELQRFMCVWLRVKQAMSTMDIAELIGWNVNTVRIIQRDFIKRGVAALTESKRGGRNHALLTPEEEKDFLASFEKSAKQGTLLVANEIKEALEKRLGHKVHKTTVYRILHRNGWRKVAPRPIHPKRDKEAGEAFKKGASQTE
jgi:transposase